MPWRFASYPAALPHVLGVSAFSRDGSVPAFSNRDPIYNDVAAPGDELFSTLPRGITARRPLCEDQGYSDCGPQEYLRPQGTSFAAAVASAGAVLVRERGRTRGGAGHVAPPAHGDGHDVRDRLPPLRGAATRSVAGAD